MIDQTNQDRGSLSVISDALPNLKGTTQKVAQYILNAPQETINLTVTELSSRVGVSEASIVRFAQSMGYSGFHALKIRLAEDIVSPNRIVHEDLKPDDGPVTAVQKTMAMGLRSMEDSLHNLDETALDGAIKALCGARQIVLFASGNSIPIAMDLNFRLTWIGLSSRFTTDPTMQEMHAALTSSEDVAVGISATGSSKHTVYALEIAKQHGARTIAITNHSASPLTRHGDFALVTATRANHFREESLGSNLVMLALTEALYVGICTAHSDIIMPAASKTLRATEHRKY